MTTVDAKEIETFARDSAHWWDENGPFKPLHRLNPVRLSYIKEQICAHYGRDRNSFKPFTGLSLLDIGCGGGLICEPMARLGAEVKGIDADANAVAVAKDHAAAMGLEINYRCASTETLLTPHPNLPPLKGGKAFHPKSSPLSRREDLGGGLKKKYKQFDIVLALEIVEHVADVDKFVDDCVDLCKPGGLIVFSTLNRTAKSLLLGKFAAEYVLRWVPQGTHDWKKFIKPSELARAVRKSGADVRNIQGMAFDPLFNQFRLSQDIGVNYFLTAKKSA
jgi:2-polyprenyl-6-hydroxyphenyl methylase/3-demethylubiquinone-9 3-methyltransferase